MEFNRPMHANRKPSQTVVFSERDVSRVLQAVLIVEGVHGHVTDCIRFDDNGERIKIPEGWPIPNCEFLNVLKGLL
jgi:hypothetical protein